MRIQAGCKNFFQKNIKKSEKGVDKQEKFWYYDEAVSEIIKTANERHKMLV